MDFVAVWVYLLYTNSEILDIMYVYIYNPLKTKTKPENDLFESERKKHIFQTSIVRLVFVSVSLMKYFIKFYPTI